MKFSPVSWMSPTTTVHQCWSALCALGMLSIASCAAPDASEAELVAGYAQPLLQEAFFDNFGSGLGRWTESGEGDWNTEALISSAGYPATGSSAPAAHADGCTTSCTLTLATPINLSQAVGGRVDFLRFVSSLLDAGEYLEAQVWNGSAWVRVRYWTDANGDDSTWRSESIDLTPYLGVADFRIRFITRQSSTLEHVHVDDVRIFVDGGGAPCGDGTCSAPGENCSTCAADCGPCAGGNLFTDNFGNLNQWTESGEGDWNTEALHTTVAYPASGSGAPAAHSDNCASGCTLTMLNAIDLRGLPGASLKFLRFVDSELDAGEFLNVQVFNGTSWITAFSWTHGLGDDNRFHLETLNLAPYLNVANFRVRINTQSSLSSEHVHIDDLRIAVVPPPPAGFQVSSANLQQHVQTVAVPRPYQSAGRSAARNYCASQMQALGYTIEIQPFSASWGGVLYDGQNVIGTRLGTSLPSETVMVSAHFDHIPDCPGADDNASGVAGMLESARLLAASPHPRTLRVACWDLEEDGILGSRAYAARARTRGETIRVNFVYDMIGYKRTEPNTQLVPGGEDVFGAAFPEQLQQLIANSRRGDVMVLFADEPGYVTPNGGSAFASEVKVAAATVGLKIITMELNATLVSGFSDTLRSDHSSFWAEGFTSLYVGDSGEFRNPNYHCRNGTDSVSTLDFEYARQMAQATTIAALRALDE
jgi:hypothetical protein